MRLLSWMHLKGGCRKYWHYKKIQYIFICTVFFMKTSNRITSFHSLSDAEKSVKERFYWFDALNNVIESSNATNEQIRKAYIDVLLGELPSSQYNELHFHIRYLIDEVRIACNRILEFAEAKFPFVWDVFLAQVREVWIFSHEYEAIQEALQKGTTLKICCNISFCRERVFIFDFSKWVDDRVFSVLDEFLVFYQECIDHGDFIWIDVWH